MNIDNYKEQNDLFFLDFFTYSQKALIETATLRTLEYKPRLLLDTISPFLDWIKGGFIIIDTLSTLTLNMNEKEAYEFMRGLKLLGHAFNLVNIGIAHSSVSELDAIASNSDGTLQFKESALFVSHFENISETMLLVATDEIGKITLKLPFANPQPARKEIPLLDALNTSKTLKIMPKLNFAASIPDLGSADRLSQKIQELEEDRMVLKTPHCSTIQCASCNSQEMEMYLQCPECQSRLLERGQIIEHFKCGNVDFELAFSREEKLVCGKCNAELKQIGVDYRKVGIGYHCTNHHIFSTPKIVFICTECKEQFDLNQAKLQTLFSYELTERGREQAKQKSQSSADEKSPVSFLFKEPIEVSN